MTDTPKRDIAALEALLASEGWRIVTRTMREEIERLTVTLASSPVMSEAELHYHRGKIYAAVRLLDVPQALIRLAQTQIMLEETPAKAGKGPLS